MLFLFSRAGPVEQKSDTAPNATSSMSQATSHELKKAKSTPILRINVTTSTPPVTVSPKPTLEVLDVSSGSACLSPTYISDQAYIKHGSFTRKIRYRLSSFSNRASGNPLVQQHTCPSRTDHFGTPDPKLIRSSPIYPARSMSLAERNPPSVQNEAKLMSAWNCRYRSKSVLQSNCSSHTSSMGFFKDGLTKAHKFLGRAFEGLSEKDIAEDDSDVSHDEDEDDLNRLYSNEMVPLEFPEEEDGKTTSSSSSPFEPEFDKDVHNTNCEDIIPGYCFKKQLSSCFPNKDHFLASNNELCPSNFHSSIPSQFTSSPNIEFIPSQHSAVKLRLI